MVSICLKGDNKYPSSDLTICNYFNSQDQNVFSFAIVVCLLLCVVVCLFVVVLGGTCLSVCHNCQNLQTSQTINSNCKVT